MLYLNEARIQMIVVGAGFDEDNFGCYQLELLRRLQPHFPGMEIQNRIPAKADILIVNLDRYGGYKLFGSGVMPPPDAYTIFIVHELHRAVYPYLKLADLVIFTHPSHIEVCKTMLGLAYHHKLMALPILASRPADNCRFQNRKIFFVKAYDVESLKKILLGRDLISEMMDSAASSDTYLLIGGRVSSTPAGRAYCESIRDYLHGVDCVLQSSLTRETFFELCAGSAEISYISDQICRTRYQELLKSRSAAMTIQTLSDQPLIREWRHLGIKVTVGDAMETQNPDWQPSDELQDWVAAIRDQIEKNWKASVADRKARFASVPVDTLEDLNIVYGEPVNAKYVFSVCLRNQENKIERCLKSLAMQNRGLDFGIVVVDDQSDDRSTEVVVDFLSKFPELNACVVYNRQNRRAARNFYNIVHLLATNPDSVIIEVDGDDFLAHSRVLDILDQVYSKGILKTNGSYVGYPDSQTVMLPSDVRLHHELMNYGEPWNTDRCKAWLPLRTTKRSVLLQVGLEYFMDRQTKNWLSARHDAAVQPRIIELAGDRCELIPLTLYCYDLDGDNHVHGFDRNEEKLKFFLHADKLWRPLILDPRY
jgi:hypothetical protein